MRWDRATEEQLRAVILDDEASLVDVQQANEELERRAYEKMCDLAEVEYDKQGRLKYNPLFHPNHKGKWNMEDLSYVCRFYDYDEISSISLGVGRTPQTIANTVSEMKKDGLFTHYKELYDRWCDRYKVEMGE